MEFLRETESWREEAPVAEKTKIKLCGMRRPEDIQAVNKAGPDYIGFICSRRFWRHISLEEAAVLKKMLDPGIRSVGVFVDEPYEEIAGWLKKGVIDLVQLHGKEDEYYIRQLRKVMLFQNTLVPVIQAFRVKTEEDIWRAGHSIADYILLDSGAGSGAAFDWSLIKKINRPYFLAGGLGPDNVAEAIRRFHPYAVDMSSSLETDRKKDPEKIQRAVREARNAAGCK